MTKKDEKLVDEDKELESPDEEKVSEIEEIDELEQLKQKLEESDGSYKRALADYQNLQKRVIDERRTIIMSANRDLLLRILSIFDTLVLANQHVESEGLKVAIKQFLDVLKSEGVTKIETIGQEFNPHFMEAIVVDPTEGSGQGGGKVTEEIQAGFMLNEKLLRPAQVKIGSLKQNKEE